MVWPIVYGLLEVGASKLIALGVIFVALTLAGTPIVFMLSIVGIIAFAAELLRPRVLPHGADPLFPFRTTQIAMGLTGGGELLVILMFLVVAEVMNASGMSDAADPLRASLRGPFPRRHGLRLPAHLGAGLGISGSAQADAAVMTPLLVPAMEKEGYPRDVAAAVVAGASIKGPDRAASRSCSSSTARSCTAGPRSRSCCSRGLIAEILLLIFQAATVYLVVRRMDFLVKRRPFAGLRDGGARPALRGAARAGHPVHHPRRHPRRGLHRHRVRRRWPAVVALALGALLVREPGARASCRRC